ncbi:hypothetical protein [Phormidesmis priestleyi]
MLRNYFQELWQDSYDFWYELYLGLTKNPRWLLMRNIGRFECVRSLLQVVSKAPHLEDCALKSDSVFTEINIPQVVKSLNEESLYRGINLPTDLVQEILKFAKSEVCYGDRKPNFEFYYLQKEQAQSQYRKSFVTANYFNTAEACPAIATLIHDPTLWAIAAAYLGVKPVHVSTRLWWSLATEASEHDRRKAAQMFHYDLDDYRFLKFFFYLTDVDLTTGPHICVLGSHRHKRFMHELFRKRFSDAAILQYYDAEKVIKICGNAGFGFVENTLCFHKGEPPLRGDRLMLQIEYATRDYGMQHDYLDRPSQQVQTLQSKAIKNGLNSDKSG